MSRRTEQGSVGAEREYRQLFGVFFGAVAVAIVVFALGVMVGEGHGPASVVPDRPLQAASEAPGTASTHADEEASRRPTAARPEAASQDQTEAPVVPALARSSATPAPRREPAGRTRAASPGQQPAAPAAARDPVPSFKLTLEGGFAVQVLAVSSRERAQAERLRVKELGYPAYVASSEDDLHRVRVGNYVSRGEANAIRDRLRRHGFPTAWVLDMRSGR